MDRDDPDISSVAPTAHADEQAPQFAVGVRLQAVRLDHGLSQRELARRANITNGTLSLIEQGKVSPSLSSLEKILKAVPMSLPDFFAKAPQAPVLHPAANWATVENGSARTRLMPLCNGLENGYLVECELAPHAVETAVSFLGGKGGYIAGLVLEGSLGLTVGSTQHRIGPGDGFQCPGSRNQQFCNLGDRPCRFVLVASPVGAG